jgi:DNA-binding transcriptional regulator YdaS (Cro superfamily)
MGTGKGGRPAGLLLNPVALDHVLGERTRSSLADAANIKASVLSEMVTGVRGVSPAAAAKIARALNCEPGVIFPELVAFSTTVRVFTASGAES